MEFTKLVDAKVDWKKNLIVNKVHKLWAIEKAFNKKKSEIEDEVFCFFF